MTEQEAIKVIRSKACNDRCTEIHCDDSCMHGKNKCVFQMAIEALEKQVSLKKFIELMKTPQYECFVTDRNGVVDILDAFLTENM